MVTWLQREFIKAKLSEKKKRRVYPVFMCPRTHLLVPWDLFSVSLEMRNYLVINIRILRFRYLLYYEWVVKTEKYFFINTKYMVFFPLCSFSVLGKGWITFVRHTKSYSSYFSSLQFWVFVFFITWIWYIGRIFSSIKTIPTWAQVLSFLFKGKFPSYFFWYLFCHSA